MVALPVRAVSVPSALAGQTNGLLEPGILKATPGQAGGLTVELVEPAARGWRALTDAAKKAGHVLKQSGINCSYRPYAAQERIFRERYTTTPNGSTPRMWRGQRWYKKPGVAAAAVPGTSNHGWGLAIDTGEERDGDTGTESVDAATLAWLVQNEQRFGFSHEIQSEPWHIRWFPGDRIPAAVLAYEQSLKPIPPPSQEYDDMAAFIIPAVGNHPTQLWNGPTLIPLSAKDVIAAKGAGIIVLPLSDPAVDDIKAQVVGLID